jgi:hypothetical protein
VAGRTMAEIWVAVRPDVSKTGAELDRKLGGLNVSKAGEKAGDSFGSGFGRSAKKLAGLAAGAFAGKAIVSGAKESVGLASDLNETVNKSNVIFGKNAASINAWSNNSVRAFGLSKNQALAAAAGFGDMFSQIGFTSDASTKMSKSVVQMSTDLGSFNNLGTDDVMNRISAALRGEFDSLQAVIPNINAARVQTEALAMSGKKNASELTAQEKAAATLAIVQKDGARAMGDFAKTMDGEANQSKIATAQTLQLKTAFGSALLPVWVAGQKVLNDQLLPPMIELAEKHGPALAASFTDLSLKAGPFITGVLEKAGPLFSSLAGGTNEASPALTSLADSGAKLAPVVQDLITRIPSLTDLLSVSATAVGFLADNTDTLAKLMPLLVGGIVAYKAAQLAANVVQVLAVPTKVAEVIVNRQLVASNKALIASRAGVVAGTVSETVATGANTAAKNVGILATVRLRAASIAHAVSSKAIAAATAVWTGAQWLLNAALVANPIGLVIAAAALLAAGFVLLWKRSETFRTVVTASMNGFKTISLTVITFVWKLISGFFQNLLDGAARAFGWVPGLGPKLKAAAKWFGDFRDSVNGKLDGLKDQQIKFEIKYSSTGVNLTTPSSVGRRARGGSIFGPGTETSDSIPTLLSNNEHVWSAQEVKGAGGHSVMERMRSMAKAGKLQALAAGGRVGLTLKNEFPNTTSLASSVARSIVAIAKPVAQQLAKSGGTSSPGLIPTLNWARTQAGKPYGWGAVGPGSYDCSGWVSALVNRAFGRNPHRRLGATGSMPWPSMASGTGPFMIGYFKGNPGHTAATINGVNLESSGGVGVRVGGRARGAMSAMFTNRMRVKGFAGGGRVGGREGVDGDMPFDLLNRRGRNFLGRDVLAQLGIKSFDAGGPWRSGTLGVNLSGKTETVVPDRGEVELGPATLQAFKRVFADALRDGQFRLVSGTGGSYLLQMTNG